MNTHHHRDHTAGNIVLAPLVAKTVAHSNCPVWQKRQAEERGTQSEQAYADTVFEDTWSADVGDETIRLDYYGRAHTSGDSVMHFEKADVVHMGDLVFNRYPCFVDRDAGATIYGWITVLEKVYHRFSDETVFIHGHGGPQYGITGGRDDLLHMRDFLTGLLEFARAGIDDGKSEDEVAQTVRLPGFEEHYSEGWKNGIPNALRKAYQELTEG